MSDKELKKLEKQARKVIKNNDKNLIQILKKILGK